MMQLSSYLTPTLSSNGHGALTPPPLDIVMEPKKRSCQNLYDQEDPKTFKKARTTPSLMRSSSKTPPALPNDPWANYGSMSEQERDEDHSLPPHPSSTTASLVAEHYRYCTPNANPNSIASVNGTVVPHINSMTWTVVPLAAPTIYQYPLLNVPMSPSNPKYTTVNSDPSSPTSVAQDGQINQEYDKSWDADAVWDAFSNRQSSHPEHPRDPQLAPFSHLTHSQHQMNSYQHRPHQAQAEAQVQAKVQYVPTSAGTSSTSGRTTSPSRSRSRSHSSHSQSKIGKRNSNPNSKSKSKSQSVIKSSSKESKSPSSSSSSSPPSTFSTSSITISNNNVVNDQAIISKKDKSTSSNLSSHRVEILSLPVPLSVPPSSGSEPEIGKETEGSPNSSNSDIVDDNVTKLNVEATPTH